MTNKTKFWRRREPQQAMLASLSPALQERLHGKPLGRRLKDSFERILPAPHFMVMGMLMLSPSWASATTLLQEREDARYAKRGNRDPKKSVVA
jgi:hypothetical protein